MKRKTVEVVFRHRLKILNSDIDSLCSVILKRYRVSLADVVICIDVEGRARYLVLEPVLDDSCAKLYSAIMESLYTSFIEVSSGEALRRAIESVIEGLGMRREFDRCRDQIMYYIRRDSFGYGILDVPLNDPDVEDVELCHWRSKVTVVHRDFLSFEALVTNISFDDEEEARGYIERLAIKSGKGVSLAKPEVHAVLPEGYRLSASLGEPVSRGPTFNIRKLPEMPIDIATLINRKVLDPALAALVWLINDAKLFYTVVGGSGAGKTTLLNSFLQMTNPNWKLLVVQDVMEIKLPSRPRFIQFFGETSEEILNRCFTALRYRPDMLVVGEVRGREISALVRAIASGSGSATTFHASTPEEFEMALRNLLPRDLYTMLSLNTALLIFVARIRSGDRLERRVWKVYERVSDEWREIYGTDIDRIYSCYTIKRLSKRLLIDDIEAELENRSKLLTSIDPGYESVEKLMRKFYSV